MRALPLLALTLVGCGTADPCDGIQGTCLSATVQGSVQMLDGLQVTVDGLPMPMKSMPGGLFDLPVRLAIVLPASLGATANVAIDGFAANMVRGSTGKVPLTLTVGGKTSHTFTMTAGSGSDGGMGDAPPPNVVSFNPSTLDFGTLPRGQTSQPIRTTLVNNTMKTVNVSGEAISSGDMNSFHFDDAGTTCIILTDASMMGTFIPLGPGQSCTLSFSFQPQVSGFAKQDNTVPFDDGEMVTFTMQGTATKAWSAETIQDRTDLQGVWGAGPNDIWAVGPQFPGSSNGGIYKRSPDGQWNHVNPPGGAILPAINCYAISGFDAQHVYAACDNSQLWAEVGGNNFMPFVVPPPPMGKFKAIYTQSMNTSYAFLDLPQLYLATYTGNGIAYSTLFAPPATNPINAVCGSGRRVVTVGAGGSWYANDVITTSTFYQLAPSAPFNNNLNGCWMQDENTVWLVGDAPQGTPGFLAKCTLNGGTGATCQTQAPGGSVGPLTAISGWKNPMTNKLELWAVGFIGGQVLRSDGMGAWMNVGTPQNQAMRGVWVSPIDGEVVAVGYTGQINHFY